MRRTAYQKRGMDLNEFLVILNDDVTVPTVRLGRHCLRSCDLQINTSCGRISHQQPLFPIPRHTHRHVRHQPRFAVRVILPRLLVTDLWIVRSELDRQPCRHFHGCPTSCFIRTKPYRRTPRLRYSLALMFGKLAETCYRCSSKLCKSLSHN
jgi:hypothetical protein